MLPGRSGAGGARPLTRPPARSLAQGHGWLCRVRKCSADLLPVFGPGDTVLNKLLWPACKIPGNRLFQQSLVNW